MKNTYLRIGNYVYVESEKQVAKVQSILNDCIYTNWGTHSIPFCEPIPLTEDWLLRFGWKRYGIFTNQLYITNGIITLVSSKDFCIDMEIEGQLLPINHIKYIHQLQNLYYALTGAELTQTT